MATVPSSPVLHLLPQTLVHTFLNPPPSPSLPPYSMSFLTATHCSKTQERDTVAPIQVVPWHYARLGFPSIQEVDHQQGDEAEEGKGELGDASQGSAKERKKKSLFAKQLGQMPLSMFGMVDGRNQVSSMHCSRCTTPV